MKAEELKKRLKPQTEEPHQETPEVPAAAFLSLIEAMRGLGNYRWADSTLSGIYDTVTRLQLVTEAQARAVRNIRGTWRDWEDEDDLHMAELGD